MNCPYCECPDDRVLETRPARDGGAIRRRRECLRCGGRYTTFEEIERKQVMIVKKDGRREPFQRAKVLASMEVACRKRSVPTSVLRAAAEEVERMVLGLPEPEVPATRVGEIVLEMLAEIDSVAYVRFASVYREFEDPEEFRKFVASIQNKRRRAAAGAAPNAD